MKILVIVFLTLFQAISFGQYGDYNSVTSIGLTRDGAVPKKIAAQNNSAHELYLQGKAWIAKNYPLDALVFDSTDYQLKVKGFKDVAFKVNEGRDIYDMDYTLILTFSDDEYLFELAFDSFYFNPRNRKYKGNGEKQPTGWNQSNFYLEKFELKSKYTYCYTTLTATMSEISESLYQSMMSELDWEPTDNSSNGNYFDIRYNYTYYNLSYLSEKSGRIGKSLSTNKELEYPFIIHLKDTIIQLTHTEINEEGMPFVIRGNVEKVRSIHLTAYELIQPTIQNDSCTKCVYHFNNDEYYSFCGQIHLFTDSVVSLDGPTLAIKEEEIERYLLFKTLKEKERVKMSPVKRQKNKKRIAVAVIVPVAVTILALLGIAAVYEIH